MIAMKLEKKGINLCKSIFAITAIRQKDIKSLCFTSGYAVSHRSLSSLATTAGKTSDTGQISERVQIWVVTKRLDDEEQHHVVSMSRCVGDGISFGQ